MFNVLELLATLARSTLFNSVRQVATHDSLPSTFNRPPAAQPPRLATTTVSSFTCKFTKHPCRTSCARGPEPNRNLQSSPKGKGRDGNFEHEWSPTREHGARAFQFEI